MFESSPVYGTGDRNFPNQLKHEKSVIFRKLWPLGTRGDLFELLVAGQSKAFCIRVDYEIKIEVFSFFPDSLLFWDC